MPFKINISDKTGKTYNLELESETLIGKELNSKIDGKEILPDLEGYEFEITGASDKSGFTAMKEVEGVGLKKVLLTYGKAMHKKPKGEGKKQTTPKGLKLRKTVRGKVISKAIVQINLKVLKEGGKKLSQVFESQSKAKEESPKEEKKEEVPEKIEPATQTPPKNKSDNNKENSEPSSENKKEEKKNEQ